MYSSELNFAVLGMLLAAASAADLAIHRIPNVLPVAVTATGLVFQAFDAGARGVVSGALAVMIVGVVLVIAWRKRLLGGGDVKLAAAAATWLGIGRLVPYLLVSCVVLGLLSIGCWLLSGAAARRAIGENLSCAARGVPIEASLSAEGGRVQVPAGMAFAIGAILLFALARGP